jgi:hypothetical protein
MNRLQLVARPFYGKQGRPVAVLVAVSVDAPCVSMQFPAIDHGSQGADQHYTYTKDPIGSGPRGSIARDTRVAQRSVRKDLRRRLSRKLWHRIIRPRGAIRSISSHTNRTKLDAILHLFANRDCIRAEILRLS